MQDNALYLLGKRMPARIIPVKDLSRVWSICWKN
jgi:hypothetical protein